MLIYNHEKYCVQAIESVLNQKCSFSYEIVIGEDSSTDSSLRIVHKYSQSYQGIIKVITSETNVGMMPNFLRALDGCNGKYVAVCEGDDYWTDPYKLQRQVDFMEGHTDCSLCVHSAVTVSAVTGKTLSHIMPSSFSRMFSTEEIIEGGGGLFATNSMLFRKECIKDLPSFFDTAPVGDYPLTVHLATQGNVHFMKDSMSAYRVQTPGSWSDRIRTIPADKTQHFEGVLKMFEDIDIITHGIYADSIAYKELRFLLTNHHYAMAFNPRYWRFYNRIPLRSIIKIIIYSCLGLRKQ